jgi:hypothetical protein
VRPFDKPDAIGVTDRGNPEARNEIGMERDNVDRVRRAFEPGRRARNGYVRIGEVGVSGV